MLVSIFSTNLFDNFFFFHSKKISSILDQNCISVFKCSTHYSCHNLMKFEFSQQIFKEFSNIKFHEIQSSGIRVISKGCLRDTAMMRATLVSLHPVNKNRQTQTHKHRHYKQVPLPYLLKSST